MKPGHFNREIILMQGSTPSGRNRGHIPATNKFKDSPGQILENACRAGMLCRLIPGIATDLHTGAQVHFRYILKADHFLLIIQGNCYDRVQPATSVNPHVFVPALIPN